MNNNQWTLYLGECDKAVYDLRLHGEPEPRLVYWPVGDYFYPLFLSEAEREQRKVRRRKVHSIRPTIIDIWK